MGVNPLVKRVLKERRTGKSGESAGWNACAARGSAFENDQHRVIRQDFLRTDVDVRVGQRRDADDIGFADLLEVVRDEFVEFIVTDFDAVRMADGFDTDFFIGVFGRNFERCQRFGDEALGCRSDGHLEMAFDFRRGGRGDGI